MNKIIATGSLLAMTALGMACGGSSTNVNANLASNKPANNTNAVVIPANTATTPMSTPMSTGNSMSTNSSTGSTSNSSTMRPSNSTTTSPSSNMNSKSTGANTTHTPANK